MKTIIHNQSGQLTFDFMIAITISLGLFILFFAMTYTFTTVEVAQYIVYSAARAQAGSNKDPDTQANAAKAKLQYLAANPTSPLSISFQGTWFQLNIAKANIYQGVAASGQLMSGLGSSTSGASFQNVLTGVSVPFISTIFSYHVPFISNSSGNAGDGEGGFTTNINTVMIREPAASECQEFFKKRSGPLQTFMSGGADMTSSYAPMEDNGC